MEAVLLLSAMLRHRAGGFVSLSQPPRVEDKPLKSQASCYAPLSRRLERNPKNSPRLILPAPER